MKRNQKSLRQGIRNDSLSPSNKWLVVLFFVCLSFYTEAQITNGMLLDVDFNGTVVDSGPYSVNAMNIGPVVYAGGVLPFPDQSARYNGFSAYSTLGPNVGYQAATLPVSFSFWIDPTGLPPSQTIVWNVCAHPTNYYGFWVNISSTQLFVSYGDGGFIGPGSRRTAGFTHGFTAADTGLHHVVFIVNGSNSMECYIDCVPRTPSYSGTGDPLVWDPFSPIEIGRGPHNPAYLYFNGRIDRFRMWNRVLTLAEITELCMDCTDELISSSADLCPDDSVFWRGQWYDQPGLYSQTAAFPGGNCDTIFSLQLNQLPAFSSSDTAKICSGDSVFFNGAWIEQAGTYTSSNLNVFGCDSNLTLTLILSNVDQENLVDSICAGEVYDFNGTLLTASGTYTDTVFSTSGCDSVFVLQLFEAGPPTPFVLILNGNACPDGFLSLSTSTGESVYWSNGEFGNSTVIDSNGVYSATASNECGVYQQSIAIMDSCLYPANAIPPRIWIPNVFSPNGDGENDSFIISGSGIEFYELIIFNRWGGKIFESINLDHVWDGSYRGKQVPDGVYMVIVRYRFMGQQENRYYGTVTVLH